MKYCPMKFNMYKTKDIEVLARGGCSAKEIKNSYKCYGNDCEWWKEYENDKYSCCAILEIANIMMANS